MLLWAIEVDEQDAGFKAVDLGLGRGVVDQVESELWVDLDDLPEQANFIDRC